MPSHGTYKRIVVLTEGLLGVFSSKTATSVIRYRTNEIVAVLDSVDAGKPLESILGFGKGIPIVADIAATLALKPDALLIGIAPAGGQLPPVMRRHVCDAIRAGLSIISGLHQRLNADDELATLAKKHNVELWDVRDPGNPTRLSHGKARQMRVHRVLAVGTDCVAGKMVTCLELRAAAVKAGLDAAFVPTGQTGIMIEGWGTSIDAVVSDFTGGAAEELVEQVKDRQICFIEGQGSLAHPCYSGVTLSLLHGTCPDVMIMCDQPGRTHYHDEMDCPIPPIEDQIRLCEMAAGVLHPAKVIGIAANTFGLSDAEASDSMKRLFARTGLPVCDPIRTGVEPLLSAIRSHFGI